MAGSKKYFKYTTDSGDVFAVLADESNTEAVNGATGDYLASDALRYWLPKNVKPRRAVYSNVEHTRVITCICLTPSIYGGVQNNTNSIPDPIGTGNLSLVRLEPERVRLLPAGLDTGLNDGDST